MANGLAWTGDLNDYPIPKKAKWKIELDATGDVLVAIVYTKSLSTSTTVSNTDADIDWAVQRMHGWCVSMEKDGVLPFKTPAQKWSVFVMVLRAVFGIAAILGLIAGCFTYKMVTGEINHWIVWGAWMSGLGWWYCTQFQYSFVKNPDVGVAFRKKSR